MQELFNPVGLRVLEERQGAIAYGWLARRVLYARFVGSLSAELGRSFVHRLSELAREPASFAYFADASALTAYDLAARATLQRFIVAEPKLASVVILTWSAGSGPLARPLRPGSGPGRGDRDRARARVEILSDAEDFDRRLANVAPVPPRLSRESPAVWQVSVPR